jgi:hypothetical protein
MVEYGGLSARGFWMAKKRRTISYTVSIDYDLVKRFRAACRRRVRVQSWIVARMMRYYLAHRYAFNNGEAGRRKERRKKKIVSTEV